MMWSCVTERAGLKPALFFNTPDVSRTRNLQIRSLTLYPIELRAQSN